jgi:hypothetical protein
MILDFINPFIFMMLFNIIFLYKKKKRDAEKESTQINHQETNSFTQVHHQYKIK